MAIRCRWSTSATFWRCLMADYNCPVCDPEQDLQPLRDEQKDGFVSVYFNRCGHSVTLKRLKTSIEEQKKIRPRFTLGAGH